MIVMSTHSVPWRARVGHAISAIKRVPVEMRAILAICVGVSVVGLFVNSPAVSMISIGLAGAIVMGQEKR